MVPEASRRALGTRLWDGVDAGSRLHAALLRSNAAAGASMVWRGSTARVHQRSPEALTVFRQGDSPGLGRGHGDRGGAGGRGDPDGEMAKGKPGRARREAEGEAAHLLTRCRASED